MAKFYDSDLWALFTRILPAFITFKYECSYLVPEGLVQSRPSMYLNYLWNTGTFEERSWREEARMKGQITFILVASVLLGVAELITLDIKLKTGFYKSVDFYDGESLIGKIRYQLWLIRGILNFMLGAHLCIPAPQKIMFSRSSRSP